MQQFISATRPGSWTFPYWQWEVTQSEQTHLPEVRLRVHVVAGIPAVTGLDRSSGETGRRGSVSMAPAVPPS